MKSIFRFSIGRKISFLVATIIIAAMGITGTATYLSINSNMRDTVHRDMLENAQDKANLLSAQLSCYMLFVKNAAQSIAPADSDAAASEKEQLNGLAKLKDAYGFLNMGLSDGSGNVDFVNGAQEQLAYQKFYGDAVNLGTVTVSAPFSDESLGKQVIMIAAPVKGQDNTNDGLVVGVIDAGIVTTLTQNITVGKSGYCFVIDETGTYVACKDKSKVTSSENIFLKAQKDPSYSGLKNIATRMVEGKSSFEEFNGDAAAQCVAYAPIKGLNWFLALRAPKAELFATEATMAKQVILFTIGFILIAILLVLALSRRLVTHPLRRTVRMIEEMSRGHLDVRLKVRSRDEVGAMAAAMNRLADTLQTDVLGTLSRICAGDMTARVEKKDDADLITPRLLETIETVRQMIGQTEGMIAAARAGELSERCDEDRFSGAWKDLARDINGLMDSVAQPINEVRAVVRQMAVNDYTCAVEGEYQGIFAGLSGDINHVRERLLDLQDVIVRVSHGDLSRRGEFADKEPHSAADSLTPAVATMMTTIHALAQEVTVLAGESVCGRVSGARGRPERFEGEFCEIVEGFNGTLDAIAQPLSEVRAVLSAMAVNDFTSHVHGEYQGEYRSMVQSIESVQENLIAMQNLAVKIAQGDISELEKYKETGRRSENDQLVPAFTAMMESIKNLIGDVTRIADSAARGNLNLRCDPAAFSGEYVSIVNSINALLDAVSAPVQEVTRVMLGVARADFSARIEGVYQGEFAELVGAVNATVSQLRSVIGGISGILTQVSQGNLAIEQVEDYAGEFAAMSGAVNRIAGSLGSLIGQINDAAGAVDRGAEEITGASKELSAGAAAQASSIEELTSSVSEISAQTGENADNAHRASLLAQTARDEAAQCNLRMEQLLDSIRQISEASRSISKIVKVIDDIAFQTKILALNAAVEAARAGVYGKGFAVVASEVGSLAQKSAQAAKETGELIENTIGKVKTGEKTADDTAHALGSIVDRADEVARLMSGIAQASSQQASGIAQIENGIEEVSTVIQSNSQSSQQSAAASEQLSEQSRQLREMINRFKLRRP